MRRSLGDKTFDFANMIFFSLLALLTIFPLWNVLMTSLVGIGEFNAKPIVLWPSHLTFESYKYLLTYKSGISNSLLVTALLTAVGSFYSLFLTTALAYGLSKKYLPGRNLFITIIMITMFFSGGLIPFYLLIRNLGMMNTFFAMFIPVGINTYNFIIVKSFFGQFSQELEESAKIDGANEVFIFFKIVLPLSKPVLATFFLFYAVTYWNTWYSCLLFIQNTKLFTLQYVLRQMVVSSNTANISQSMQNSAREAGLYLFEDGLRMATVVIATIPIVCVYPFLQKHFVKGVMIGSVKG